MTYNITTENGERAKVTFKIIKARCAEDKRFGIFGKMAINGNTVEEDMAAERFFTRREAYKTAKMLCKYSVTPCTLCQII